MSAGMAFEALNNAGAMDADLLVILNDNEMSISPAVGALNNYLARLMSGRFYTAARRAGRKVLGDLAERAEEHVKGMVTPGTMFEEFGFNYIGPIDGHDLDNLIPTLRNIRAMRGPQFLHVITRKGQGYKLAEADPVLYHGVSTFKPDAGISGAKSGAKPTYTQIFGDWLCDMAREDERLIGITPAMREGSGLVRFAELYPSRYFDVGIAEQHAVTFAAGLACDGMKPVVAIYSTFLQRAYDQLIHDVAIQNLPVVFALDRGGIVGADGPTHHGAFDLSYLRAIPNMTVMTPADENECRQMLYTAFTLGSPAAVRYPRGSGPGVPIEAAMRRLDVGKGELRRRCGNQVATGRRVAFLAFGTMLWACMQAAETLDATVVNMRFVKPLDAALVREIAGSHDLLVCVEENVVMGGAGSAVLECLHANRLTVPVLQLGLPDQFVEHGDPALLVAECGLNAQGILQRVQEVLAG
jgi:1-deoxy-D-xylulose-5-phosphate synthase